MDPPTDGPLHGWQVAGTQTAGPRAGAGLLRALGATEVPLPAGTDALVLTAPDGARQAHGGFPSAVAGNAGEQWAGDWAVSGAAWLTGRHDGPPLVPPGPGASFAGGAGMAYAVLAAHFDPGRTSPALDGRLLLGERAALMRLSRQGPRSCGGGTQFLACADGPVALTVARDDDVAALPALLGREAIAGWAAVRRWAAAVPAAEVVQRAGLLGLGAGRLPGQLAPALPAYRLRRLGPRYSAPQPLVVDLTGLWAGPLTGQLLTRAGARVVKVESTTRPDGARGGPEAFFQLLHAGQRSVALPLHTPAGLDALRELVSAADLVLEAARPRVRDQWGLRAEDAGGSWLALRAYDRSGPDADRAGFGDDVAVAAGLAVQDSRGRWLPVGDAIADPLAGVAASVAALAALLGTGRWEVETSLQQAVAQAAVAGPGVAAHRLGRGWAIDLGAAAVKICRPSARPVAGRAAELGADSTAVFTELRVASSGPRAWPRHRARRTGAARC